MRDIALQEQNIQQVRNDPPSFGTLIALTLIVLECYCGSTLGNTNSQAPIDECSMLCAGNSLQFCGGPNRMNVYNYTGNDLPAIANPGAGAPNILPVPVKSGLLKGWSYASCYVCVRGVLLLVWTYHCHSDNAYGRISEVEAGATKDNTVHSCVATCAAQGFKVAGTEFATECCTSYFASLSSPGGTHIFTS
jgi:hypothetical protein